jgi:MFS family permease
MGRIRLLLTVEASIFAGIVLVALLASKNGEEARSAGSAVFAVGAGFMALQALLLLPIWRPRARRSRGVPVWLSLTAGAALAAALLGGFVAAVHHALGDRSNQTYAIAGAAVAAVAWPIGTLLFVLLVRARPRESPEWIATKMCRSILRGTAFEALAVVPLDVMIRKKSDCYCVAGSIIAWGVCIGVGVVVFGPAALLPAIARKRDLDYARKCDGCGAPSSDAVIPEGSAYRETQEARCGQCGEVVALSPARATARREG